MSPKNALPREEFTFSFQGPAVERHEIEVSLLAESLVAFRALAERSCKLQYGKGADLLVKVKGGFRAGSFEVQLIIDWATKNPDAAVTIGGAVICGTVAGLIKLYQWAKGGSIKSVPAENNTSTVTNAAGQTFVFNNSAVILYNTSSARSEADKLTRPLEQPGIESLAIAGGTKEESATVLKSERAFFRQGEPGNIREDENVLTLEVINANLRGEDAGWRVYDGSVDYSVHIDDQDFLQRVSAGEVVFKAGDMIEARMRIIQKRPAQRLVTERTITEILAYIPAQKQQ